jgi:hypothetical protein
MQAKPDIPWLDSQIFRSKITMQKNHDIVITQVKPDILSLDSHIFRSKITVQNPLKNAKNHDIIMHNNR